MKLVVLNKEEINIEPGASLSRMSTEIEKYTDLENLENKLTKENLKVANFVEEDVTVSTYTNMCVIDPLFLITKKDGKMFATFGLRKLTENELQENDVKTAISYLTDEQAVTVKDLYEEYDPNGKTTKKVTGRIKTESCTNVSRTIHHRRGGNQELPRHCG